MKTVNVIGPLKFPLQSVDKSLFTVFVDGGLKSKNSSFKTSISIGDMDSTNKKPDILLRSDKDRSDLYFACYEATVRGAQKLLLHGFFGGRLDHQVLMLGDLLELSQDKRCKVVMFENGVKRVEILPPGNWNFNYRGMFSVISLYEQKVRYSGGCAYPKDKEYPQIIKPFSTFGLSNYSDSDFSLDIEKSLAVYYVPHY